MESVCVYCGSADNMDPVYLDAAYEMGAAIAERGLRLIYGAGSTGLMGAVADGALGSGGEVIGVIPKLFNTPTLAHSKLSHLEVVEDIHVRKARMIELAEAFIALPGGFGTLEELFEVLTWAQIGLHHKPIGLLNTRNYFNSLLKFVKHAQEEGFIFGEHQKLFTHTNLPEVLLNALVTYKQPSGLERWLTRKD